MSRSLGILIADDSDGFSEVLARFLKADGLAHTVWRASSGEGAIEAAADERPDLVLMDISMPGIGGIEATRWIKAASPEIPVIMLTAHDDAGQRAKAVDASADAFLCKSEIVEQLPALILSCPGVPVGPLEEAEKPYADA